MVFWVIAFSKRISISLRIVNFDTGALKVNDLRGNPIEVGAIVVWRIKDAAQAAFNIDDYRSFVANQSDIAIQ